MRAAPPKQTDGGSIAPTLAEDTTLFNAGLEMYDLRFVGIRIPYINLMRHTVGQVPWNLRRLPITVHALRRDDVTTLAIRVQLVVREQRVAPRRPARLRRGRREQRVHALPRQVDAVVEVAQPKGWRGLEARLNFSFN